MAGLYGLALLLPKYFSERGMARAETQQRVDAMILGAGMADLALGVAFVLAWWQFQPTAPDSRSLA